MAKLIELERDKFLEEVTSNWSKWKNPTTVKDLAKYMQDNAFTKKANSTLIKLSKEELREIILNGDDDTPGENKKVTSPGVGLGSEIIEFLEEAKIEVHKKAFNPFVKKQIIKQIDKQAERIEDVSIFDKLGVASMIFFSILLVFEMIFANGFKDIIKKLKEYKQTREAKQEVTE